MQIADVKNFTGGREWFLVDVLRLEKNTQLSDDEGALITEYTG